MIDYNSISLETVIVNEIIQTALDNLAPEIQKTKAEIALLKDIPKYLQADRSKMIQIFQDIISHALQSSTEDRNPVIIISGEKTESEFLFHIEDNGIGIPEEHKDVGGASTRLLPMSTKLVTLHGGQIRIKSAQKEGSIYSFSIPK